jgi:hypothetical protein
MSRIPSFFRQAGNIKPPKPEHPVQSLADARAYFKAVGSAVRKDGDTYILDHRGWSHAGVSAEGLIHIANEDARLHPSAQRD